MAAQLASFPARNAHPARNPQNGPSRRRPYAYAPPDSGYRAASAADELALAYATAPATPSPASSQLPAAPAAGPPAENTPAPSTAPTPPRPPPRKPPGPQHPPAPDAHRVAKAQPPVEPPARRFVRGGERHEAIVPRHRRSRHSSTQLTRRKWGPFREGSPTAGSGSPTIHSPSPTPISPSPHPPHPDLTPPDLVRAA